MHFIVGALVFMLYVTSACALFNRTQDSVAASALFIVLVHVAVAVQIQKCM